MYKAINTTVAPGNLALVGMEVSIVTLPSVKELGLVNHEI